jgi:hypothetical protein
LTIKQLAETIQNNRTGEIIWDSSKPMVHQKINGHIKMHAWDGNTSTIRRRNTRRPTIGFENR